MSAYTLGMIVILVGTLAAVWTMSAIVSSGAHRSTAPAATIDIEKLTKGAKNLPVEKSDMH